MARAADQVTLPVAPFVHVLVTRGPAELEDVGELEAGDAVRLTAAEALPLRVDEALVWEMHSPRDRHALLRAGQAAV